MPGAVGVVELVLVCRGVRVAVAVLVPLPQLSLMVQQHLTQLQGRRRGRGAGMRAERSGLGHRYTDPMHTKHDPNGTLKRCAWHAL